MHKLVREFWKLTKKEREFVFNCQNKLANSEKNVISNKPLEEGWIEIVDNHYQTTKKFMEFREEKVNKNLNIAALKRRVRDGLTTEEDALFELEVFEKRIKEAKLSIKEIKETVEFCDHDMKPYRAESSFNLFNQLVCHWFKKCSHCGKESVETTNSSENRPEGFKDIQIRHSSF